MSSFPASNLPCGYNLKGDNLSNHIGSGDGQTFFVQGSGQQFSDGGGGGDPPLSKLESYQRKTAANKNELISEFPIKRERVTVLCKAKQPNPNDSLVCEGGALTALKLKTMSINPTSVRCGGKEIRIPEFGAPIKVPVREWDQCVENTLINDQVRRPLARTCYKREVPPITIPACKIDALRMKINERCRKREECEKMVKDRAKKGAASYARHSELNFTVEKLLARKRQKEMEKERRDVEETEQILREIKEEEERKANELIERAKMTSLRQKGLIRNFHSAMSYSKIMQDIEEEKKMRAGAGGECREESSSAQNTLLDKRSMLRLLYDKRRSDGSNLPHCQEKQKETQMNQELIETLRRDEMRVVERQEEIQKEIDYTKTLMVENGGQMYKNCKDENAEKDCDKPKVSEQDIEIKRRKELQDRLQEIQVKMSVHKYMASQEREVERQAYEYNEAKAQMEEVRKDREKEIIDKKVEYNMKMSEKAKKLLEELEEKKKEKDRKSDGKEYDSLREQWECDWEEKSRQKKTNMDSRRDAVIQDFLHRKKEEENKQMTMDPAKEWARQRLRQQDESERDVELRNEKKKKEEDIGLFHLGQMREKEVRFQNEKYMDIIWQKQTEEDSKKEMCQMKKYAENCIDEWKHKGRNVAPMLTAMKKWDRDSDIFPHEAFRASNEARCAEAAAENIKKKFCLSYETTATRLGFNYEQ